MSDIAKELQQLRGVFADFCQDNERVRLAYEQGMQDGRREAQCLAARSKRGERDYREPPGCAERRDWCDILYSATAHRDEDGYFVSFWVYQLIGGGDTPLFHDDRAQYAIIPTEDFTHAAPWLSGHVKWDGCSNWLFLENAGNCALHFCHLDEQITQMATLFRRLGAWAAELMPEHQENQS